MKETYKEILNVALSSRQIEKKVAFLENEWGKIDENLLFKYAKTDEISSHIAFILKKSNINYQSIWDKEYKKVERRIRVLMDTLEDVALILKNNDIEIVALKNAGITKAIFKNNACSPMGDIDLLVRSHDFRKAHSLILNEMGFIFKFRSEFEEEDLEEAFRGGGTEYYKFIEGYKVWLELQWRPIAGRWIQPHNEPNGNKLMDNSIEVKNSEVRILAPEDNLLQVALHTAKHSYVRAPGFRLHSDVDRIVRFQDIDWGEFEAKVKNLKVKTSVYFSLFFAKELLETPIPDAVLKNLRPNVIRSKIIMHFIEKAGFFNKKKKKFSKLGYIIFILALYDSLIDNLRAVFPSYGTMKIKYPIKGKWQLPYYYVLRVLNLLFQRAQL